MYSFKVVSQTLKLLNNFAAILVFDSPTSTSYPVLHTHTNTHTHTYACTCIFLHLENSASYFFKSQLKRFFCPEDFPILYPRDKYGILTYAFSTSFEIFIRFVTYTPLICLKLIQFFSLPSLLRCHWQIALRKFKMYSIIIWLTYIIKLFKLIFF